MRGIRIAWRIISILLTAVLTILLVCNLYTVAARAITGEKQPMVFGYTSAVVISGSMSGSIEVNDMVIIHRQDHYASGDIITFESGSSLVTHRILEETAEGFVTKGDANNTADAEPVPDEAVVGRVVLVIPKIGRMIEYLRTPLGMTCFVLLGVLLVMLPSLIDRKNKN